jgi:hypothetical protein
VPHSMSVPKVLLSGLDTNASASAQQFTAMHTLQASLAPVMAVRSPFGQELLVLVVHVLVVHVLVVHVLVVHVLVGVPVLVVHVLFVGEVVCVVVVEASSSPPDITVTFDEQAPAQPNAMPRTSHNPKRFAMSGLPSRPELRAPT